MVAFVVAVTTWIKCKKIQMRRKSFNVGEPKTSNPDDFSDSQNSGIVDERDKDQYHEIDDITASVTSPEHFDERDDEGYSTIRDDAGPEVFPRVQTDKRTHPLPLPPDKQDMSLRKSLPSTDATSSLEPSSMPRQSSYGAISPYPRSIRVSTSANVPSIESPNTTLASITTDSSTSLTAVLVSPSKITTRKAAPGVKKSSTQASLPSPWQTNPVPHKFPYRAAQYYYLGLVNIRSGHPSLSIQSQIKLVRKIDRDMELVTSRFPRTCARVSIS